MKYQMMTLAALLSSCLLVTTDASAFPDGSVPPNMMDVSATFAKARAQMRAYEIDINDPVDFDLYDVQSIGTNGCDVNLGNVVVDNPASAPDDIIVFVQGDIIQANNCR